jgi:hypothetical protein
MAASWLGVRFHMTLFSPKIPLMNHHRWPILRHAEEAVDARHMSQHQSNVFWLDALMMATLCSCV